MYAKLFTLDQADQVGHGSRLPGGQPLSPLEAHHRVCERLGFTSGFLLIDPEDVRLADIYLHVAGTMDDAVEDLRCPNADASFVAEGWRAAGPATDALYHPSDGMLYKVLQDPDTDVGYQEYPVDLVGALSRPYRELSDDGVDLTHPDALTRVSTRVVRWSGTTAPMAALFREAMATVCPVVDRGTPRETRSMPSGLVALLALQGHPGDGSTDLTVFDVWVDEQTRAERYRDDILPAFAAAARKLGIDAASAARPVVVNTRVASLMLRTEGCAFVNDVRG
jgi:hypothetical protein